MRAAKDQCAINLTKGSLVSVSLVATKLRVNTLQRDFSVTLWLLNPVLMCFFVLVGVGVILRFCHLKLLEAKKMDKNFIKHNPSKMESFERELDMIEG